MVRPVSLKGFQKGFQGVSLRGFRGFQIFLWELYVCINTSAQGIRFMNEAVYCIVSKEYRAKAM